MGVGPRLVGWVEDGIQPFPVHQVDEELAERFAARDESPKGGLQIGACRRRRERALEPPLAGGRHLARGDQVRDREYGLARLRAPCEIRDPGGRERTGRAPERGAVSRVVVRDGHTDGNCAGGGELLHHAIHRRRHLTLAVMPTNRWRRTPIRVPASVAESSPPANEPLMCAPASVVTGSSGSKPVTRSRARATSRTDLAIGPTASL